MEGVELINAGWLSILPPLLAIVLALLTKEVILSLTAGVLSGMLIYAGCAGGDFIEALINVPRMMAEQIGGNGMMLLFLSLLGALVIVVTMAGGSRAYGNWAHKKIRSRTAGKFLTWLLGIVIFIDDYFNCLTVGTVMRPVTDKLGISREKLAYIIDATAAPICIIAPISSWAVAVASQLGEGGFETFLQAIPYNLYALMTFVMVGIICFTRFDFGPMRKAELRRQAEGAEQKEEAMDTDADGIHASDRGTIWDLIVPVLVLIAASIVCMAYVGGWAQGVPFVEAIGENPTLGLTLGALIALIVAFAMYIPRRLVKFRDFMGGITQGVKSMVPAMVILVLAWSLSSTCRYMLGTGDFVSDMVAKSGISLSFLPAVIFAVAAFISFSTGTAWGTFGILLPIAAAACQAEPSVLIVTIGAVLAGSVFGDHCSPISDTTILSSAGAKCDHIAHVSTQIPYAILVAAVSFVGYLIAGFVRSPWLPLLISAALLLLAAFVISRREVRRDRAS